MKTEALISKFERDMKLKNFSPKTISVYTGKVRFFFRVF